MPKNRTELFASALVVSFLFLSLATTPAIAQVTTGSILGTIHDSTGAVVPNAVVVATNTATGAKAQTLSSSTGNYVIPNLPVGPYQVGVAINDHGKSSRFVGVRHET